MKMEDHPLPIYIETRYFPKDRRFGRIIGIEPRTRCTRRYTLAFEDGSTVSYKGAASRPNWIEHIFKSKTDWLLAIQQAKRRGS